MPQIVLLAVTVAGVLLGHARVRPAWTVAAATAAGVGTGTLHVTDALDAVDALREPLAFLVTAVPLAVLLDRIGFFDAAAERVAPRRHLSGALWVFAAAVTTVCNLDAAIVLLTPLYLRIARRHGLDPVALAFQPVLLASLASSALPVSNLTNLIVQQHLDADVLDFVIRLGPASLAATVAGWWAYRRCFPTTVATPAAAAAPAGSAAAATDPRAMRLGVPTVALMLLGFTVGAQLGLPAWMAATVLLLALALLTRTLPVRAVPIEATVVAAGLAAITAAAAPHLRLDSVLGGTGLAAQATTFASGVVGANAVNNLPALLVGLPSLPRDTTWAFLAGVNTGPTLWISGSLAGLLWADIMRHHGHPVTPAAYARVGVRVGLPALLATLAVLLADAALRSGISGSPW